MKKTIVYILIAITVVAKAQNDTSKIMLQDPEAQKVLDATSKKINNAGTLSAAFTIKYVNRRDGVSSESTGDIVLKKDKYVLNTLGSKVIFDGENMYNIMADLNEVTITKPDPDDEDFVSNPAKIFNFYNRDFKYRYNPVTTIGNKNYHDIDLYPVNLEQPYSRFNVLIDTETMLLYQLRSVGKDAEDYIITLTKIDTGQSYEDTFFQFDESQYSEAEIIDMRF